MRTFEPFVIQKSALLFQHWQPIFKKWLQNFEVTASKFDIDIPLTSIVSKMATPNILKIDSNQCISSKLLMKGGMNYIIGGNSTKTKYPQQWGVIHKLSRGLFRLEFGDTDTLVIGSNWVYKQLLEMITESER